MAYTASVHIGVRGREYSAAQSALTGTAWRIASLPARAATACAGMLPERLCWALSGLPALQGKNVTDGCLAAYANPGRHLL